MPERPGCLWSAVVLTSRVIVPLPASDVGLTVHVALVSALGSAQLKSIELEKPFEAATVIGTLATCPLVTVAALALSANSSTATPTAADRD